VGQNEGTVLERRAGRTALRFAPVAAILALQLIVFPVPAGVWTKGAIVGGLTALIALGMALTWRSNGVVSFAQGDMGMAPVVLVHLLIVSWGWSWYVAVPAGLVVAALLGAVVEIAVIRRFRRAPRLLLTVATIGLAQVLAGVAMALPRLFDEVVLAPRIEPPFKMSFSIGHTVFTASEVLALISVPLAVGLLALLLQRSNVGLAARAAADSADRASLLGIPVGRVQTAVWSVAAVLAFVAVLLRAGVLGLPIGAALSLGVLLRALTALLVGRLTDLPVIAATAVALGVLELAVAFNASSPVVLDPILAGVVAIALLLRGASSRRGVRTADDDATSWRGTDDVRPIPDAIARLTPVRLVRTGGIAVLVAIAIALPYLLPVDRSLKSSALLIYALLGCSVVVLTGWAGQVSLGQVALFAIGAAVGAKATMDWHLDLLLALVVAGAAGAVAAVVIGFPALRLRGLELAVVTLAAAIATTSWLLNPRFFGWVPHSRVARPPLLGRFDISSPVAIHHLSLALLLLGLLALRGIRSSRTGRALLALRDNERGAQAYGLSPLRLRLTAFALSGAIAGVAGAMFAHHQQAFGSQPYAPVQNLTIFTMVVLGGVATPMGAVLGAVWLQGTRWFLPGEWQLLASGAGVLAVLLIVPSGLGGLVVRIRDAWLGRVATTHGLDVPGFTTHAIAAAPTPIAGSQSPVTPAPSTEYELTPTANPGVAGAGATR
jgi:branched-chain amino acid transport system permease protein